MKSYQETLEWMFQQLPMYQRVGKSAFKKDLSNTLKLAEHLGHPENKFRSIHVAGTNGKGSVSHMLASTFQEAGYKTGLYTSPHLKDFRERIRINGVVISEEEVVGFIEVNQNFLETNRLSFFEMTVGMAFDYFAKSEVDIAIIETGLGGRLDSTNIITPQLSVITNIGLDHTAFLGTDMPAIATEKAGIIKNSVPVVIGERHDQTMPVFTAKAAEVDSPLFFADEFELAEVDSDLIGTYQEYNKKTVLASIEMLRKGGWKITSEAIIHGLNKVQSNTGLRGRWEILGNEPKIICDTAHNAEGLKLVLQQLLKENFTRLHIVLGVVNDKDLNSILPLFPKDADFYFAKPDVPRGMPAEFLQKESLKFGLNGNVYSSISEAYITARIRADTEDLIFIGGSNFTVAEVL
ncbi:folylpolyglutamate synthase/dihydrofolate synthase family protein [uncultured Christiangramia sp.]|uniref:bifunctional folylpolyglutamate synthase/dihydrofolate synthase n=1 Tax=uncultured Christiangramia sp. TaxID=503836 RepID=UPI00260ED274|nr:folylpolyglutamate synthase/dihydrofolate synthase family protein [uncultured Christiangramia sp.]